MWPCESYPEGLTEANNLGNRRRILRDSAPCGTCANVPVAFPSRSLGQCCATVEFISKFLSFFQYYYYNNNYYYTYFNYFNLIFDYLLFEFLNCFVSCYLDFFTAELLSKFVSFFQYYYYYYYYYYTCFNYFNLIFDYLLLEFSKIILPFFWLDWSLDFSIDPGGGSDGRAR